MRIDPGSPALCRASHAGVDRLRTPWTGPDNGSVLRSVQRATRCPKHESGIVRKRSVAFSTRFRITCSNWVRLALTSGWSSAKSSRRRACLCRDAHHMREGGLGLARFLLGLPPFVQVDDRAVPFHDALVGAQQGQAPSSRTIDTSGRRHGRSGPRRYRQATPHRLMAQRGIVPRMETRLAHCTLSTAEIGIEDVATIGRTYRLRLPIRCLDRRRQPKPRSNGS